MSSARAGAVVLFAAPPAASSEQASEESLYRVKTPTKKEDSLSETLKRCVCFGGQTVEVFLWLLKETSANCRATGVADHNYVKLLQELRPDTLNKHRSPMCVRLELSAEMRQAVVRHNEGHELNWDSMELHEAFQAYLNELAHKYKPEAAEEGVTLSVMPSVPLADRPLGLVDGAHRRAIFEKYWAEYNNLGEMGFCESYEYHRVLVLKPDTPEHVCKMVSVCLAVFFFCFAHLLFAALLSVQRGGPHHGVRQLAAGHCAHDTRHTH
jgi:hypothetical protein